MPKEFAKEFKFERDAPMEEEQLAAVKACLLDVGPRLMPLEFSVIGSVVMSLAASWVRGFKQKEQRVMMAHAFADAIVLEAERDDEPEMLQ